MIAFSLDIILFKGHQYALYSSLVWWWNIVHNEWSNKFVGIFLKEHVCLTKESFIYLIYW